MNGGQNNPGTVRISVPSNASTAIPLSKQEINNIVRCDKLEVIVVNPANGSIVAKNVFYPMTAFVNEENVTGTLEFFRISAATATGLTIVKAIFDTVLNTLSTSTLTYAPKTAN